MSKNHVRRLTTASQQTIDLAERRAARPRTLVALRDQLAAVVMERHSHGVDAASLQCELDQLELAIKAIAPQIHADLWASWLRRDASLLHDAAIGRQDCALCAVLNAARTA